MEKNRNSQGQQKNTNADNQRDLDKNKSLQDARNSVPDYGRGGTGTEDEISPSKKEIQQGTTETIGTP